MRKTSYVVAFFAVLGTMILVRLTTLSRLRRFNVMSNGEQTILPPRTSSPFSVPTGLSPSPTLPLALRHCAHARRPPRLVVRLSDIIHKDDIVTYGLSTQCELRVLEIPGPNGGTITYTNYECRPFPMRVQAGCEEENKTFCMIWSTSRYFGELGIGFAVVACLAILFGVTTHSRRRRIWKTASALVVFHGG